MRTRFAPIGLVTVALALVVVALLVARSWTGFASRVAIVRPPAADAAPGTELPNLHDMRARTDEHAEQVREALQATSPVP